MLVLLALKSIGFVQATEEKAVAPPLSAPAPLPGPASQPRSTPMPPPVSEAERGLLLDLRKRREALDARAAALDARGAVLDAAERKLAGRLQELGQLQARLESLEHTRQMQESANWSGLVHIYEAMKPRDAAAIFDSLDMQVLLAVLDRMQERRAAPVLAAMQPDRARLATQMLAELRLRTTSPK